MLFCEKYEQYGTLSICDRDSMVFDLPKWIIGLVKNPMNRIILNYYWNGSHAIPLQRPFFTKISYHRNVSLAVYWPIFTLLNLYSAIPRNVFLTNTQGIKFKKLSKQKITVSVFLGVLCQHKPRFYHLLGWMFGDQVQYY